MASQDAAALQLDASPIIGRKASADDGCNCCKTVACVDQSGNMSCREHAVHCRTIDHRRPPKPADRVDACDHTASLYLRAKIDLEFQESGIFAEDEAIRRRHIEADRCGTLDIALQYSRMFQQIANAALRDRNRLCRGASAARKL